MNSTDDIGTECMLFPEVKSASTRLVLAAGTLIAGECAAFALPRVAGAWGWIGFTAMVVLLAAYGWGANHLKWPMLFLLGMVLAFHADSSLANILARNSQTDVGHRPLELTVGGDVHRWRRKGGGWNVDFTTQLGPMPLKVVIPVARGRSPPVPGDRWEVDGWISRKQDKSNRFAQRSLWVPEPRRAHRLATASAPTARFCWARLGKELSHRLGAGMAWWPEIANLNRAILLGQRSGLSPERKQIFVDAGTIHVFAISGLHVVVVAWLINALLCRLDIPAIPRGLLCMPLIWGYVTLTGTRPSAVRAALMSTFCLLAPTIGRRPDPLASWSITALLVYGIFPERLFDLGCTLSFTVMFGIVLWLDCSRHFSTPLTRHEYLARCMSELGVSIAAWTAGVPITAYSFGRFTPGGLLANLVVIKCASPMVKLGASSLVASFLCLPLAALLNNTAGAFTWIMSFTSECVAALPFSNFAIVPWSLTTCTLWYLGCLTLLLLLNRIMPRREKSSKRWWK